MAEWEGAGYSIGYFQEPILHQISVINEIIETQQRSWNIMGILCQDMNQVIPTRHIMNRVKAVIIHLQTLRELS